MRLSLKQPSDAGSFGGGTASSDWETASDSPSLLFDHNVIKEDEIFPQVRSRFKAARSAILYADRAPLYQNYRRLQTYLNDPSLDCYIAAVDEVGFSQLRFSTGQKERGLLDFLYKALAFSKALPIYYRVVIEKTARFWLSRAKKAKLSLSINLAA